MPSGVQRFLVSCQRLQQLLVVARGVGTELDGAVNHNLQHLAGAILRSKATGRLKISTATPRTARAQPLGSLIAAIRSNQSLAYSVTSLSSPGSL